MLEILILCYLKKINEKKRKLSFVFKKINRANVISMKSEKTCCFSSSRP